MQSWEVKKMGKQNKDRRERCGFCHRVLNQREPIARIRGVSYHSCTKDKTGRSCFIAKLQELGDKRSQEYLDFLDRKGL